MYRIVLFCFMLVWMNPFWSRPAQAEPDAQKIVEACFDYMRDKASVSTVVMTIHRPDWEREMVMKAWTRGRTDSLIHIISPAKDKGNGTLKKGPAMWLYNPKINRVIKLPPSMMSQAWMGSDFSNNDLAKSDTIINDYHHRLIATENDQGVLLYVIESIPKPDAPVVWGMQRLKVRADHILLYEEFFDEDRQPVKLLTTHTIEIFDGKPFPKIWRMQKQTEAGSFTRLTYRELSFKPDLPDSYFTLTSLRNPRR